jgi:hypothetical protein
MCKRTHEPTVARVPPPLGEHTHFLIGESGIFVFSEAQGTRANIVVDATLAHLHTRATLSYLTGSAWWLL